jgi:multiple antibiotic resistance protein
MSLSEYILFATSSLFLIIDPIALIPIFLAITPHDSPEQRNRMAGTACVVAAIVLMVFALIGQKLFAWLGITLPAFKIAGSIVLLLIALDMLRAQRSRVRETSEETEAAVEKEDVAITPLAVPMMAGPGAISTVILLQTQAKGWPQEIALFVCIPAACAASYVILRLASRGAGWISPIAMKIVTRIMGLLLAAVAIQVILDALADQKGKLF